MRIAYVVTRADEIGGVQVHVRDLATGLHAAGHEVTVLAGAPGSLFDQLNDIGVRCEAVPSLVRPIAPRRDALAVHQLTSILRRRRPELVSLHSSKAGWLGRIAAKLCRLPVVFTAHGWPFTGGAPTAARWIYPTLERLTATLADRIVTVSDYDRAVALEQRIAPPQKITRIHNGIVDRIGRTAPAPPATPVRIVMTGRLSPQKDQATLLRALGGLRHLDWVLDLVGRGPGSADIAALAHALGIADRVRLCGERHDVPAILGHAHVYVLASNWEGFPRSILEAMSAWLPVVATDLGGVAEAVDHGKTGFLVPHADDRALALRLETLIRDGALRRRLGAAGRQRYENEFRFELMYERTAAVYRAMIAARGTATVAARSLGT